MRHIPADLKGARLLRAAGVGLAAVAAVLALVASASAGGSPQASSLRATSVPVAASATAPATISPDNTGFGLCNTGPGQECDVEYLMTKGTATATAYGFGPSGGITSTVRQTCDSSTCTKKARAYPSPNVTVNYWQVSGPNITVICSGPTWLC